MLKDQGHLAYTYILSVKKKLTQKVTEQINESSAYSR